MVTIYIEVSMNMCQEIVSGSGSKTMVLVLYLRHILSAARHTEAEKALDPHTFSCIQLLVFS